MEVVEIYVHMLLHLADNNVPGYFIFLIIFQELFLYLMCLLLQDLFAWQ